MAPLLQSYMAGVGTSMAWTGTSIFFTAAARRIGPTAVNAFRIVLAVLLLGVTHRLLAGVWIPEAVPGQVWLLAASGLIGLTIGDQFLLVAFVDIGPRLGTLLMTTAPIFAATFGRVALGETLGAWSLTGMAVTIVGVAWAVLERRPAEPPRAAAVPAGRLPTAESGAPAGAAPLLWWRGVTCGVLAAACQAGGLLLSKQGMGKGWLPASDHLSPQAATLVRMFFASLGLAPLLALHALRARRLRRAGVVVRRVGKKAAGYALATFGAICGPYIGVWLSLKAAENAPVGIAQTLASLAPVFLLPFAAVLYKEPITLRAVMGALLAVAGTALIFVA